MRINKSKKLDFFQNLRSRYFETRLTVDIGKCIGCGDCKPACPTKALNLFAYVPNVELPPKTGEPRFRAEIKHSECIQCGRCQAVCRRKAIQVCRPPLVKLFRLK